MSRLSGLESGRKQATLDPLVPHILVVDDEPLICQQLERLYTHSGYAVTIAPSAEEALERLDNGGIDLVVTDIRLPGMSGVELTKRIQDKSSDVPVIVITGYGDIETALKRRSDLRQHG